MNDQHQRAYFNDYTQPRIYMITISTLGRKPLLGHIMGIPQNPHGTQNAPKVELTPLGWEISKEISHIKWKYPQLTTPAWQIMPDHVHFVLHVYKPLPTHLNDVIYSFIDKCNKHHYLLNGSDNQSPLFEYTYHDRILSGKGQLQKMIDYIHDNPRRLLIKQQNHSYFKTKSIIWGEETLHAIGNIDLLNHSSRIPVRISRHNNNLQIEQIAEQLFNAAKNGSVLVSPFISPGEKIVKERVLETGFPIIIISDNGISPFYKPSGILFERCAQGKVLIVSPFEHSSSKVKPTKQRFEQMNLLAIRLSQ